MFDKCSRKTDPNNIEHLACTEIRKYNLGHCNLKKALVQYRSMNNSHSDCVRNLAIDSLIRLRFVPEDKAIEAVDKVFGKCYNDLGMI